ncbi:cell division ATP-binding protein FtsE [Patescibacteria group bacterium]|nr:cell division ATP-binding protein FtsE [Patescibacteria group bacterium]
MIKFEHITKIYNKDIKALKDLNFEVADGEFLVLVGPSGAGKSTLIKLLICEEKPTRGHIYIVGKDVVNLKAREVPYFRRRIGVVFQDFKLLPKKNVYENISFALEVVGASSRQIKKKVEAVLDIVGLKDRKENFPDELSGGEKQRVAIARAVVNRPKLLIADEPTGNLDPKTSWDIIRVLEEINKRGTIILLATHNKDIVDRIRKRVIKIKNGRIVSDKERAKY